ncbi:uncharacterized protein G2W53_022044 [Senna tora]|uniref:Uncharacterized protein n=1 Tax=Senna tora TaxID=362788 RepID=A0A834TNQ5_9FABA|nr:uncharacterized protein G2W53_022044 [Senna tora]
MGYTKEGNELVRPKDVTPKLSRRKFTEHRRPPRKSTRLTKPAFINDALVSISGSFKASINDAHSAFSLYWIVVITCRHHQNNSSVNAINLSFKNIILIFRLSLLRLPLRTHSLESQ